MRATGVLSLALGMVSFMACEERVVAPADVARIVLEPEQVTIEVGETRQFLAQLLDASGNTLTGREVEWMVADEDIASVDEGGRVTALSEGETRILAAVDGRLGEATVVVTDQERPVGHVTVSPTQASLDLAREDAKVKLEAQVYDDRGRRMEGRPVKWRSDRPLVADVDEQGMVRPRAFAFLGGRVMITATSQKASATAIIEIESR